MKRKLYIVLALMLGVLSCQEPEPDPTISVSKSEYYASAAGERVSVPVTSNKEDWTFDTGASWITGEKSGNSLLLDVQSNTLFEPRTSTVKLNAGAASASFTLTQAALVFEPQLSIDVANTVNVSDKAQSLNVNVSTNMASWTVEKSDADWLAVSASGNSLKLDISQNNVEMERSADITIFAPNKEEFLMQVTFTVLQAEADIQYETTNLSEKGCSNSYIISHKGPYTFKATVKGNGKTVKGLEAPDSIKPEKAKLVWQTSVGVITSVKLDGENVSFTAGKKIGNALIAVTDAKDNILWSWHIWRPESEPYSIKGTDGSQIMNMNLGATTEDYSKLGCYGLLYQWGRKDPFPGSDRMNGGTTSIDNIPVYDLDGNVVDISYSSMYNTSCNTLAYSIAHPTVCIAGEAQKTVSGDWLTPSESNTALWGNPNGSIYDREHSTYPNKGSKTYYDPCPVGWRVAHIQTMYHITSLGSLVWATGESDGVMTWSNLGGEAEFQAVDINKDGQVNLLDFQNGWWIYLDKSTDKYSFFPATSRYYGYWGQFMGSMVGYWGNYWTNSPSLTSDGKDTYKGIAIGFGIKEYGGASYSVTSTPTAQGCRNDGYSIRCIKE